MVRLSFLSVKTGFGDPANPKWLTSGVDAQYSILNPIGFGPTYIPPVAKSFSRLISPYASHPSLSHVHSLCSMSFCLVGGGVVTNLPMYPFQIPPGLTYTWRCSVGPLFGILHAVNYFQT